MSKTSTVDLYVSQLIADLSQGLSWFKKEDLGFGSIQDKYGANDIQIKTIQKHPKLVGLEPSVTVFRVIDDLKDEPISTTADTERVSKTTKPDPTKESKSTGSDDLLPGLSIPVVSESANLDVISSNPVTDAESADAFFSL